MRAAVRGRSESSIQMRLMANLPLPAPFTEHVRFSLEAAHCHLSSHLPASKCNTVPVSEPTCAFMRSVCQSRRGCQSLRREVRPFFFLSFSLFAFDLNPRSWRAGRHRAPAAVHVLSFCSRHEKGLCELWSLSAVLLAASVWSTEACKQRFE